MVCALLSDLHLEEHPDRGEAYLDALNPEGVDLLVLAGDICAHDMILDVMKWFSKRYDQIVYVLGNHEYHESSFEVVEETCKKLPSNIEWLERRSIEWRGLHILGATLWFEWEEKAMQHKDRLSDFRKISGFDDEVFERNAHSQLFLRSQIRPDSLVVTHHLPTFRAITSRFKDSPLIPFFCCDLSSIKVHPKTWMFGHTHWSVNIQAESHFIANPLGNHHQKDSGHSADLRFIF